MTNKEKFREVAEWVNRNGHSISNPYGEHVPEGIKLQLSFRVIICGIHKEVSLSLDELLERKHLDEVLV